MRSLIIEQTRLYTVKYFSEGYIEQDIKSEGPGRFAIAWKKISLGYRVKKT